MAKRDKDYIENLAETHNAHPHRRQLHCWLWCTAMQIPVVPSPRQTKCASCAIWRLGFCWTWVFYFHYARDPWTLQMHGYILTYFMECNHLSLGKHDLLITHCSSQFIYVYFQVPVNLRQLTYVRFESYFHSFKTFFISQITSLLRVTHVTSK